MPDYARFDKVVLARQEGRLLIVTLNRPERLNAVGDGMHEQLTEILHEASADKSVGAILLRGEGRAFCVGGDVKDFAARPSFEEGPSPAQVAVNTVHGAEILHTILSVPQPIIAAVHGFAMGLGATIALFSDIVIAAEDATIADTHVLVGLVAGDGGAVMFPLLAGLSAARYYLLTGERISGAEAARLGLVFKAVPAEELMATASAVGEKLANGAPLAVQWTKAVLNRLVKAQMTEVLETGLLYEGATFVSEDHREASQAFVEKRPPVFRGR